MFLFTFWLLTVFPLFFSVILPYFLFSPSLPVISLYFFIWSCYFLSLPTLTLFFFFKSSLTLPHYTLPLFVFLLNFLWTKRCLSPLALFLLPCLKCAWEKLFPELSRSHAPYREVNLWLSSPFLLHLTYVTLRPGCKFSFFFFLLLTRLLTLKI